MRTGKTVTSILVHHSASWDSSIAGFFKGFFGQPAILVGLFALIGCIIQRKKVTETITSTLKVVIGFFIITAGAAVLSAVLENLTNILKNTIGVGSSASLVIPSNEAMMSWFFVHSSNIMTGATAILLVGMVLNIVLAKFSKLKYIYLSGHLAFFLSIALSAGFDMAGIHTLKNVGDTFIVIISGATILSLYMVVSPAINQKYASKVMGNDNIAIGHSGSTNFYISGLIGDGFKKIHKRMNKKIKYTEDIKVPEKIMFLKNGIVSTAISMFFVFILIVIIGLSVKGLDVFNTSTGSILGISEWAGLNWGNAIIYPLIGAFTFTAGVQIIIFGVKMFLEELTPAFSGISTKLVKGAKPAVEVQAFWEKNPNAVIIGFLSSFVAGLTTFGIITAIHFSGGDDLKSKLPIVLPQLLPHFFIGATAAIWANSSGGLWASITGSAFSGVIITIIPIIFFNAGMIPHELLDDVSATWSDPDGIYSTLGFGISKIGKYALLAITIILFILPIIYKYVNSYIKGKKIIKTTK